MPYLGYIDDGHTIQAVLHAVPRLYDRLAFSFRPMTVPEIAAFQKGAAVADNVQLQELVAANLAARLKGWGVIDRAGKPVPITKTSLLRLQKALFDRLFAVVSGLNAPDEIEQDEAERGATLQAALEAAERGLPLAVVQEETDRKNS